MKQFRIGYFTTIYAQDPSRRLVLDAADFDAAVSHALANFEAGEIMVTIDAVDLHAFWKSATYGRPD